MQKLWQEIYSEKSKANRKKHGRTMNIITLAFDMADAVGLFVQKAKSFFYNVMLFGYRCPKCNNSLTMVAEGMCKCNLCELEFDPTVQFQRCSNCGAKAVLKVRRYSCKNCGSDIRSKFLFDGLVFEKEYFKAKMAESRKHKKEQHKRVKEMLAKSRSNALPLQAVDFSAVPDLVDALNSLTAGIDTNFEIETNSKFDLNRYQSHIQAHIQDFPVNLLDIPPLNESARKDVIWRFIAVIFLAHTGIVDIWQEDSNIMVIKHEANREGQRVFGELEETNGIERFVGRVEA